MTTISSDKISFTNKIFSNNNISLCLITKNEDFFLEDCLNSVKNLVDEIIIVDTGSSDRTKEIASRFTDKIFDFQWCDDFSAARNESLKHATGDWILILDADEILPEETKEKIRLAIKENRYDAFFLPQMTLSNIYNNNPTFVNKKMIVKEKEFSGYFYGYIVRLFRRSDKIFFDYFVHESVNNSLEQNNLKIGNLFAPIVHLQELKEQGNLDKKQEYYFRLSLKNIEKYPHYAKSYNDVAIYYNVYLKDKEKALYFFSKAVELDNKNIEFKLNLSFVLRDLERYEDSLKILLSALEIHPDERVLIALGYIYYKLGNYNNSLLYYQKVLDLNSPNKEKIKNVMGSIKKEWAKIQ